MSIDRKDLYIYIYIIYILHILLTWAMVKTWAVWGMVIHPRAGCGFLSPRSKIGRADPMINNSLVDSKGGYQF
jgi:hypothetical protein